MHADILQVRAPALNFYVLRDPSGLYLLDAGFIGGRSLLRRALRDRGWDTDPIRGIIVTHGHLDHILNVAPVARETGAWIAAPRLDAEHYCGRPVYRGWARVTDGLEKLGRPLLGFQPFTPDRWLDDGDRLDVFQGGLCAVHLLGTPMARWAFIANACGCYFRRTLWRVTAVRASLPRFSIRSRNSFRRVPKRRWHWTWTGFCPIIAIGPRPRSICAGSAIWFRGRAPRRGEPRRCRSYGPIRRVTSS